MLGPQTLLVLVEEHLAAMQSAFENHYILRQWSSLCHPLSSKHPLEDMKSRGYRLQFFENGGAFSTCVKRGWEHPLLHQGVTTHL
jgi:hypothetical protein